MGKPQVFDDQEQERVFERVAAVDVAKASGVVCLRLPHPAQPAGRRSQVWEAPATMHAVKELARRLAAEGVQNVTLESTSAWWRIWFYVLEEAGLDVQLVSASQARNLPGRPKTDLLTELPVVVSQVSGQAAIWLATVARHDHRRGCAAGLVPAGGAARRVA